jgi:hypothetical protein
MLNVGLWCARRAVAFVVVSMSYLACLKHKVHFLPISAFRAQCQSRPNSRGLPFQQRRRALPPSLQQRRHWGNILGTCSVLERQREGFTFVTKIWAKPRGPRGYL